MMLIPTFETKFDEYNHRLSVAISTDDFEWSHALADEVLCDAALDTDLELRQRIALVEKWHKVKKCYA